MFWPVLWLILIPLIRGAEQRSSTIIGPSTTQFKEVLVPFDKGTFSTSPSVICTVRGENLDDTFVVSTRAIDSNGFNVIIFRVDSAWKGSVIDQKWNQQIILDWYAWDSSVADSPNIERGNQLVGPSYKSNTFVTTIVFKKPFENLPVIIATVKGVDHIEAFGISVAQLQNDQALMIIGRVDHYSDKYWWSDIEFDYIAFDPVKSPFGDNYSEMGGSLEVPTSCGKSGPVTSPCQQTISFPVTFNTVPNVLLSVVGGITPEVLDVFGVTIRQITANNVVANIVKLATDTFTWPEVIQLQWYAWNISSNPSPICPPSKGITCSGHGQCTGSPSQPGTCLCDSGWGSSDCSLCNSGWYGPTCAECHACSPHGRCNGTQTHGGDGSCICDLGWAGDSCFLECQDGCSNHGSCLMSNSTGNSTAICQCDPGFGDTNCARCAFGYVGNTCLACLPSPSNPCSGHGVCVNGTDGITPKCNCQAGWMGDICNSCSFGYFSFGGSCMECPGGHNNPCSKHGTCTTGMVDAPCACDQGWQKTDCSECQSGFIGDACEECPHGHQNPCNMHGTCKYNNGPTCACDVGWGGNECTSCATGYYGSTCLECPGGVNNICSTHGSCDVSKSSNPCICKDGFMGEKCDQCKDGFYNYPSCTACPVGKSGAICNGKGTCNGKGSSTPCQCEDNWTGTACDKCTPTSYGANCTLCDVCINGKCDGGGNVDSRGSGRCVCAIGWDGDSCDVCAKGFVLFNNQCVACPLRNNISCNGQGFCVSNTTNNVTSAYCDCHKGWSGDTCSVCDNGYIGTSCLECPGGHDNPCNGNGLCTLSEIRGQVYCDCKKDYAGSLCAECPGGVGNACSGHGDCVDDLNNGAMCFCETGWIKGADNSCSQQNQMLSLTPTVIALAAAGAFASIICGGCLLWQNKKKYDSFQDRSDPLMDYGDSVNLQYSMLREEAGLNVNDVKAILGSEAKDWLISSDQLILSCRIGVGSSGEVFKGTYGGRDVAVKRLFGSMWNPDDFEAFFKREASLLCRLHHPNVVRFFGVCYRGSKFHLVTELCKTALSRIIQDPEEILDEKRFLFIASGVASGIAYLHSKSIAHRDLKPENILVDIYDEIKLCDFGVSRFLSSDMTAVTGAVGTPAFMAPEMTTGGDTSIKVDVYSFGILLWTLRTREYPYQVYGLNPFQLMPKVVQGLRPAIDPDTWPPILADLVIKCWDGKAENRPSFEEIIVGLQHSELLVPPESTKHASSSSLPSKKNLFYKLASKPRNSSISDFGHEYNHNTNVNISVNSPPNTNSSNTSTGSSFASPNNLMEALIERSIKE